MSSKRQQQLTQLLDQFYHQPIAKVSLELFLSIGAVIFFAIFAIQPTLITMSNLVDEIEQKKEVDGKLSQKIAALASAQSEFLSLQPQIALLNTALPTTPDIVTDLKTIEKIASENSLVINNLNMTELPPEKEPTDYRNLKRQSTPISISVQGDYRSIKNFVKDLRNLRRSISVNSVIFSLDDAGGQSTLSANIILDMPYFGEDKS